MKWYVKINVLRKEGINVKSKKEIIIISILAALVVIFIVAIFLNDSNKSKYLADISYDELVEKINNSEDFILYIGRDGCSACEAFNPKFKKIINKYKITVYYIDLEKYTDDEKEYVSKNISFRGTPTVVFMQKGKDSLNADTKIEGNISESKIIQKLKNRGYIK